MNRGGESHCTGPAIVSAYARRSYWVGFTMTAPVPHPAPASTAPSVRRSLPSIAALHRVRSHHTPPSCRSISTPGRGQRAIAPLWTKPSPLRIGQSESLAPELLFQNAVLFSKIVDDRILLARDPTGHGGHEDLPGIEHRCHPAIVAASRTDRQLST